MTNVYRYSFLYWLDLLQNYHELCGYSLEHVQNIVRRKLHELGGLGGVW